jgi:hypothetical protein
MLVPDARVWGKAGTGYATYDFTELHSATESLYHDYLGNYVGYTNYAYGGPTLALGASAYAFSDGSISGDTLNYISNAVPYHYFAWRVVRNPGVTGPANSVPVDLYIVYAENGLYNYPGGVGTDAYFNDPGGFGYLWFKPTAGPGVDPPGAYTHHHDALVDHWNSVYMQLSAYAQNGNVGGTAEMDATFTAALSVSSALDSTSGLPWDSMYHLELDAVAAPLPEPSTLLLLGPAMAGVLGLRRRSRN